VDTTLTIAEEAPQLSRSPWRFALITVALAVALCPDFLSQGALALAGDIRVRGGAGGLHNSPAVRGEGDHRRCKPGKSREHPLMEWSRELCF
jgi:hypothetical protein